VNIHFRENKNSIYLEKTFANGEKYKVERKPGMFTLIIYEKPQITTGVSSLCEDGSHVLFLDYDNTAKWIVEKESEDLIETEQLPPIYLFKTKEETKSGILVGNYHAYCLIKLNPHEIVRLQQLTSCDQAYKTMPLRNIYRSWVLRLGDKKGSNRPQYVKTIGTKNLDCHVSTAHLKLLYTLYPKIKRLKYEDEDKLTKVKLNTYETP